MAVTYDLLDKFEGWGGAASLFISLIEQYNSKRILEIGSGANPTLTPEYVKTKALAYVTSDICAEELAKADKAFERLELDMAAKHLDPALTSSFDFIASRMVNEHIKDGLQYHRNIHQLLRPGGISVHCFSTLWNVPFAANRLLPESLSNLALNLFNPRADSVQHGKFRAYYSWSRGPSKTMVQRFENLGYKVIRYSGYFGHPYYKRLPLIDHLESLKSRYLLRHPVPQLCSYATVVLQKSR